MITDRTPTILDLPPNAEKASLKQLLRGSHGSYIYFLCDGDECVYVGQSVMLRSRLRSHAKDKNFDSVFLLRTPIEMLDECERNWIRLLSPTLNRLMYAEPPARIVAEPGSAVTRKILLTLPPDWLAAFEAAAKKQDKTLVAWLRDAGAKALPASVRKSLSTPRKPGRQPK